MIQYFMWTEQLFISVAAISYLKFAISMKVYYEISRYKSTVHNFHI